MTAVTIQGLSDRVINADRRWKEAQRQCQELVEELTLLQASASVLCQAMVGPPKVRSHLLEGIWVATTRHTAMAKQLTMLWVAVSLKDRGGNQRGGGCERSLIKFFHKNSAYVPHSKRQEKIPERKDEKQ
jgi:hypothetical protein